MDGDGFFLSKISMNYDESEGDLMCFTRCYDCGLGLVITRQNGFSGYLGLEIYLIRKC